MRATTNLLTAGKGLGGFAGRDHVRGERIIAEAPLVTWAVADRKRVPGSQAAALLAKRARKPLAPSSPPSASTGTSGALPAAAMLEAVAADKTEL